MRRNHQIEVTAIRFIDFEPEAGVHDRCGCCGWASPPDAVGIMEQDLWSAPTLLDPAELVEVDGWMVLVWADGQQVTEDDVVWVVLCGVCLGKLPQHPCHPMYFDPDE